MNLSCQYFFSLGLALGDVHINTTRGAFTKTSFSPQEIRVSNPLLTLLTFSVILKRFFRVSASVLKDNNEKISRSATILDGSPLINLKSFEIQHPKFEKFD